MAKRSDIEAQIAALQADLDGADTDDEVWIKEGDHEVKISGKRATTILGRYAKLWETDEADDDSDDDDDDDSGKAGKLKSDKAPKGAEGGYFRKGKAA